jgi:translation elongation factor EF-1alpha
MAGTRIGEVTHYFDKISVAVLDLADTIQVGDKVHFLGHSTDFHQEIKSLQIEHQAVEKADPGQDVALKVEHRVRPKDVVYKITEEEM